MRDIVTDEEFSNKREALQIELASAQETAHKSQHQQFTFEPVQVLSFSYTEPNIGFLWRMMRNKRNLLKILCSNPTLRDKKALLEPKYPFQRLSRFVEFPRLCGNIIDVGTAPNAKEYTISTQQIKKLKQLATDRNVQILSFQIKQFLQRFDPDALSLFEAELHKRSQNPENRNTDQTSCSPLPELRDE